MRFVKRLQAVVSSEPPPHPLFFFLSVSFLIGGHVGALSNWVSGGFKIFSHPHGGHAEQIHPGLIGQRGVRGLESRVIKQVTRTNKHLSDVKPEPPNKNLSGLWRGETHKSASFGTVAV